MPTTANPETAAHRTPAPTAAQQNASQGGSEADIRKLLEDISYRLGVLLTLAQEPATELALDCVDDEGFIVLDLRHRDQ